MDVIWALGLGTVVSFLGCLPMAGPNAALILQRLLDNQRRSAAMLALGVAAAEAVYAAAVAIPLPHAMARYQAFVPAFRIAGGVMIAGAGVLLVCKPRALVTASAPAASKSFATGVAVAVLNPTLFVTWTAVCSTLYGNQLLSPTATAAVAFACGAGLGDMLWFVAVAATWQQWARFLTESKQSWLMRGLGATMVAAAIWLVARGPT